MDQSRSERLAQRDRVASLYPEFRDVQAAAKQRMIADANIEAIWLFGSRARGTAKTHSDWDVAVVTRATTSGKDDIRWYGRLKASNVKAEIACYEFPRQIIQKKRTSLGHIVCELATDGIPLAERTWLLPTLQPNEHLSMDHDQLNNRLEMVYTSIGDIATEYLILANPSYELLWVSKCANIVSTSQHLAEGFIKASLLIRGKNPPHTHDVDKLAKSALAAGVEESFVATIRTLNDDSRHAEQIRYSGLFASDVENAARRIQYVCQALLGEYQRARETMLNDRDELGVNVIEIAMAKTLAMLEIALSTMAPLQRPQTVETDIGEESLDAVSAAWDCRNSLVDAFGTAKRELDQLIRS